MRAWKNGFVRKQLYEKYVGLIWGKKITYPSYLQAVYAHAKHKPPKIVVVSDVQRSTQGIAKMMTELYSKKIEGMSPEDISTSDYVRVNKLVLDEQKLSLDKNAQMLEFAKIFGIPEPIQGELEEDAQLEPPEDEGDKQASP